MKAVTLSSVNYYLITEEPNGDNSIDCEFSLLTSANESSTRREERNALSVTARALLNWHSDLDRDSGVALQISLRGLGRDSSDNPAALQPILCPFWPGSLSYLSAPIWSAKYSIIYEPGFTNYLIYVTTSGYGAYAVTDWSLIAPLLFGVLDGIPTVTANSDEITGADFTFKENGPAANALSTPLTPDTGPSIHGQPWKIFAEIPQYDSELGAVDLQITRKQIGYVRDEAQTLYPQTPERKFKSDFTLDPNAAAKLFSLWLNGYASVTPFWLPAGVSPMRLAADVASTDTSIHVDNAANFNNYSFLFFQSGTWAASQVNSIVGNVIGITASTGTAFDSSRTIVQPLLFVHFVGDKLALSWVDPSNTVTAKIEAQEIPPEFGSPPSETLGTTIGPLGLQAYLYWITDGVQSWYVTSFESSITYNGNTYSPQHITHGTITERLNLSDSTTAVEALYWSGNPFSRFRIARLQQSMSVTIMRVTSATPATNSATTIFFGTIKKVSFDDDKISVDVGGPDCIFDVNLPRPLFQKACNAMVFDSKCGLVRSQWTFSCTMGTPPSPGSPYQYAVSSLSWPQGALPSLPAHYFALGFLVRTLADGTNAAATILDSTAISSGSITLTLDGDLNPFPTGSESWSIIPGCAGRYIEDCGTKFNNKPNFRGFPNMPKTNPLVNGVTQNTAKFSKK